MSMFNPVDLSRILILLKLDILTLWCNIRCNILNNFFGRYPGIVLALTMQWALNS